MTAGTGKVSIGTWRRISQQAVVMTGCTAGSGCTGSGGGHEATVIRLCAVSMNRRPRRAVTVATII